MHVRKRVTNWIHQHTHRQAKHKQTHKHTPEDGSMRPKLPPVLSQLLVTRVTQLQAQLAQPQLESDEDGKMEKSQERIYIKRKVVT